MRIAVTSAGDEGLDALVSPHFGQCPYFTLVDTNNEEIETVTVVANPHYTSHRPGEVPSLVRSHNAEMIVAGGMGRRAIGMFEQLGIQAFTGAQGTVRQSLALALGGHLTEAAPCVGHGRDASCGDHAHWEQVLFDAGGRGCCHAGLLNTLAQARWVRQEAIVVVVGGIHLAGASDVVIEKTISILGTMDGLHTLWLGHCSGQEILEAARAGLSDVLVRQESAGQCLAADAEEVVCE